MLKGWLGFRGWQLSDYKGTRSTVDAANHGHDMQMPGCVTPAKTDPLACSSDETRPNFFGEPLKIAVLNGSVTNATIDEKVMRILGAMFEIGMFDAPKNGTADTDVTSKVRGALCMKAR
jgi:beta-glucosidase